MNENVVILPVITRLDVPVERIMEQAIAADLGSVIVIGYDKDGEEYFASSMSDGGDVLWLMERMKLQLLRTGEDK